MDTRKLLVADPSPCFCDALARALCGAYELRVCHDGHRALALLEEFSPDVIVTDLTLPGVDGFTLMKTAAARKNRPAMLVTTRYHSAYIEKLIGDVGADYVMVKPCDIRALADRVEDLASCEEVFDTGIRSETCSLLLTLGMQASRKGFGYLEELIELYRMNPCRSLTKDLYPAVGKAHNTSSLAVERAVRDIIHQSWCRRDDAVWRRYFMPGCTGQVSRPTNRAFIANLAQILESRELCLA